MSDQRVGYFIADAERHGMTPEEYARHLVTLYGNAMRAALNTGYTPNTFRYWLSDKAKQIIRQRIRKQQKRAAIIQTDK